MSNYFSLILDTLAPGGVTLSINSNAAYASTQLVDLAIGCSDSVKTGYQMKIWGDVDTAYDASIKATEVLSAWASYSATKQIKLATGDGSKTVYLKIRDDVYNESAQVSDAITLDTTLPFVTISVLPDVTKISKVSGKDVCSFSFQVDAAFIEYKAKVVASISATQDIGTLIPITNGSTNMSGTGTFPSVTNISCTIKGTDLEAASSGDATKIIKVFAKDVAGNWSV